MKAYRDTHSPLDPHVVTFDRVRLTFGEGGLLRNPDADELAAMTANAIRRARFVEADVPAKAEAAPPPQPAAAATPPAATPSTGPKGSSAKS